MRAFEFFLRDRKSTRLNSSHMSISYAGFCLKKKKSTVRTVPSPPSIRPARRVACDLVAPLLRLPCHHRLLPFFFNDTATPEIYTLSLHDALPICCGCCHSEIVLPHIPLWRHPSELH